MHIKIHVRITKFLNQHILGDVSSCKNWHECYRLVTEMIAGLDLVVLAYLKVYKPEVAVCFSHLEDVK